jgi:aminopeptidase-like protein
MNSSPFSLENYFDRLWPICRSITGNGLRESLKILSEIIPLEIHEIPTGTKVFDWEIPKEWNIRDAWIEGPDGKRYAEFSKNNLHLFNYSIPVDKEISFDELQKHIKTLPGMRDAIPYMTSYYSENWGFCLSQNEFDKMPKTGIYRVHIDSTLTNGSLTYGELIIPGKTGKEILISTYVCHPGMAVNELSGPLVTALLYKKLMASDSKRKFTYRFLFAPETIGVIAFLAENGFHLKEKLEAGYVVTCVGHDGKFNYKRSKKGNSSADKAAEHILKYSNVDYDVRNFSIGGSDERQYCSAGFNFPVGSLMRTPYKEYKEYHTSADNKSIISFEAMEKTADIYLQILQALELNERYSVTQPYCELQLGKRGLYPQQGGNAGAQKQTFDLLHFLSYADGAIDLIDIAEKANSPISDFKSIIDICRSKELIS